MFTKPLNQLANTAAANNRRIANRGCVMQVGGLDMESERE
jgi:hypothetical protein